MALSLAPTWTPNRRHALALAAVIIALDQLTKWWVLTGPMNPPTVIQVTPFANLVLVWNRGVSFGMFNTGSASGPWILAGVAIAVSIFLVIWLFRQDGRVFSLAVGGILGGAIGNVIDRFVHGAVADFVDLHAFGYHWPAFNLADSAITLGAAALILDSLFQRDKSV